MSIVFIIRYNRFNRVDIDEGIGEGRVAYRRCRIRDGGYFRMFLDGVFRGKKDINYSNCWLNIKLVLVRRIKEGECLKDRCRKWKIFYLLWINY